MAKYVLIDSGYWFGLYDNKDSYRDVSVELSKIIYDYTIIIPYPSLYEVLNSTFVKNKIALESMEAMMKSEKVEFIMDGDYRETALKNVYEVHKSPIPKISLVDSIIREIVKDVNVKIDALITYNGRDFRDVCDIRNIPILP